MKPQMQKIRSEPEPDEVVVVLVLVLKEVKVEEADGWCCRGGGATDNGADPDLPDEEKSCEERCLLLPFCDDDGEDTALTPLLVQSLTFLWSAAAATLMSVSSAGVTRVWRTSALFSASSILGRGAIGVANLRRRAGVLQRCCLI